MSRGRKRKSDKGLFSPDSMKNAVKDVVENKLSLRKAAEKNGVKYQTLARYVKKAKEGHILSYKPQYDTRRILDDEQEVLLKSYILHCSKMCYGKSTKDVRQLAYELCVHNNINMPETWIKNKSAGLDWLQGFMKRHSDISIRQPEGCSLSRVTSFNRSNVEKFFNNLETVLKRFEGFAEGTRIFNLDETATTTVQKSSKIIAPKGVKQINKVTSGERGILVTTCCIISSAGIALPPVMVFPRVNFKTHFLNGAPTGTLGLANPSGWMTSELFVSVIKHFIKHSGSSKRAPTLLILDNHESHFSVESINIAKDNGVTMLTLPPHCSNKLQPLDVSVYGPFKTFYNSAIDSWMMRNPGIPVTIFQVAECVGYAFDKAMSPSNIKAGFKKCGIMPFDRHIFDESDYLMSSVTDRKEQKNETERITNIEIIEKMSEETPGTSTSAISFIENVQNDLKEQVGILNDSIRPVENCNVKTNKFISPEQLFGYPKAQARKLKQSRQRGRSKIVTDTPEKLEIEEKDNEKKRKKSLQLSKGTKRQLDLVKKSNRKFTVSSSSSDTEDNNSFISDFSDPDSFSELEFEKFKDKPQVNSYVLVEFHNKKSVFYIAKIIAIKDSDIEVTYLRHSNKIKNAFIFPQVKDIALIKDSDIKCVLPPNTNCKGTRRQQAYVTFGIKFESIDIR